MTEHCFPTYAYKFHNNSTCFILLAIDLLFVATGLSYQKWFYVDWKKYKTRLVSITNISIIYFHEKQDKIFVWKMSAWQKVYSSFKWC